MTTTLSFRLVDAFATGPYTGNPAGVVLDAGDLSAAQMQSIAREVNASETAFVCGNPDRGEPARLRWFTPLREVDFCGHATLAAAQASFDAGYRAATAALRQTPLQFDTRAGVLALHTEAVRDEPPLWWLGMPTPEFQTETAPTGRLLDALGLSSGELDGEVPVIRTRDQDTIVFVRTWTRLNELTPKFADIATWGHRFGARGVLVATRNTLSPGVHVQSRFFAPMFGINEDPVTGSVHGPLAALLVSHGLVSNDGGRTLLTCLQGEPGGRTGIVRALVDPVVGGYRVHIAGQCYTTIRGTVAPPAQVAPRAMESRFASA